MGVDCCWIGYRLNNWLHHGNPCRDDRDARARCSVQWFWWGASALVGLSEALKRISDGVPDPGVELYATWTAIGLSALVGWITLSGSLMAMMKLKGGFYVPFSKKDERGRRKWISFPTWGPPWLNWVKASLLLASLALIILTIQNPEDKTYVYSLVATSTLLGILFVLPIGGADMPVVVSLLNSLSGIAYFTGFVIGNNVLIIAGSMVGAMGLILTFIMCKAMNRELFDVLFKAFGGSGRKISSPELKLEVIRKRLRWSWMEHKK